MLRSAIVRLVELCTRYAWTVIVLAVALSSLSAVYAVRHFAVKTDVNNLFPANLPWAGASSARTGLCFLPADRVAKATSGIHDAGPLLANLSADQSLRGALGA